MTERDTGQSRQKQDPESGGDRQKVWTGQGTRGIYTETKV